MPRNLLYPVHTNVNILEVFGSAFGANPTVTSRAPGRIEFIGNHTDYNGGLVMGAGIDRAIDAALSVRPDRVIRLHSEGAPPVQVNLDDFARHTGSESWVNYPLGMLTMLRDAGLKVDRGFDIAFTSTLPVGAGLSSSAALELSTAYALIGAFGGSFDRAALARLGRRAENEYVGVPSGILDQGVSAHSQADHLVMIDCRVEAFSTVSLPHGVQFWIFNSHKKHALVGSLYATRHQECMDAARILSERHPGTSMLSDFSPEQVQEARAILPDALYRRALHVTGENARVLGVEKALAGGDLAQVGRLLVASHESSRDLFENSTPELDFLVAQLQQIPEVYGARLSGGGFGGAVMAMTSAAFGQEQASRVAHAYANQYGDEPDVLHTVTAPGARLL